MLSCSVSGLIPTCHLPKLATGTEFTPSLSLWIVSVMLCFHSNDCFLFFCFVLFFFYFICV